MAEGEAESPSTPANKKPSFSDGLLLAINNTCRYLYQNIAPQPILANRDKNATNARLSCEK